MGILGNILSFLWKLWFLLVFVVTLVAFYPFFAILLLHRSGYGAAFALQKVWGRLLLLLSGITWEVRHRENIPKGPFVICPNHFSYLDIVVMYVVFPEYFIFMAKAELLKVPLFRIFFRTMSIAVERSSRKGSHQAFVLAGEAIDRGESVVIFPEGTIGNHAPALKAFKNGAFKLAVDKQVPIVPVTFLNNFKILQVEPIWGSNGRPMRSVVTVHKPILTKGLSDDDLLVLKARTEHAIAGPLRSYGWKKNKKH